jgi:hypothetical protein
LKEYLDLKNISYTEKDNKQSLIKKVKENIYKIIKEKMAKADKEAAMRKTSYIEK